MEKDLQNRELVNLVKEVVKSGFSKKVLSNSIEKAKALGASTEYLDMLRNAVPMCE